MSRWQHDSHRGVGVGARTQAVLTRGAGVRWILVLLVGLLLARAAWGQDRDCNGKPGMAATVHHQLAPVEGKEGEYHLLVTLQTWQGEGELDITLLPEAGIDVEGPPSYRYTLGASGTQTLDLTLQLAPTAGRRYLGLMFRHSLLGHIHYRSYSIPVGEDTVTAQMREVGVHRGARGALPLQIESIAGNRAP